MKKISLALLLIFVCSQSHAGIWDSITGWFGDDEEEQVEQAESSAATKPEATKSVSKTNDLIQQGLQLLPFIIQQLGVSEAQASGGMGALLQTATSLLSSDDSKTLLSAIPNASSLLKAAPVLGEKKGDNSMLSGALKAAGEYSETAKAAAQLSSQFEALGMGAEMIPKFTKATESYLGKTDHKEASDILSTAMGSLF